MEVSVIIPVYNRSVFLKQAVSSVLQQTYSPKEVIVVDDGSSEDIKSVVKEFNDERLTYAWQPHQGVAAARNFGINLSKTSWLAFLDSDDYWLPTKLAAQVNFHQQHPDIFISQTNEVWLQNGKRLNQKKYHQKLAGNIFKPSLARCLISPSAVLLHKKVLATVGLFDETLPACEDYDLWLRVTLHYWVGLVPPALVVKNGGHSDQLSQQVWALDRYRVKALLKLLKSNSLNASQRQAVVMTLIRKLLILKNGAAKRCLAL